MVGFRYLGRFYMDRFTYIVAVLLIFLSGCRAQTTNIPEPRASDNFKGSVLAQFERELTGIVERVSPSVVTIFALQEQKVNPLEEFDIPFHFPFPFPFQPESRQRRSLGSGVIVKKNGDKLFILTNNHVVRNAKSITVRFDRHTERKGKLIGGDPKTDIAVIEVNAKGIENIDERIAKFGNSDNLKVGQIVIAIGNPYGLERTITVGVISALKRSIGITQYESFIQTDAAINPGNSGGPLINIKGEVIGINTAIVAEGQGLGFAIPINLAKWVMEQIIENGRVIRGWLGVVIQEVTPDIAEAIGVREGILVAQVMKGSPADKAGIKVGDVIVEIDGKPIDKVRDVQLKIMKTKPGTEVKLKIIRDGKELTLKVKIGELPEKGVQSSVDTGVEDLGLSLRNPTTEEKHRLGVEGAIVVGVAPGSPAYMSGLRPGDIILRVNNIPIKSKEDFYMAIDRLKEAGKSKLLLLVRRGRSNVYLVLSLK